MFFLHACLAALPLLSPPQEERAIFDALVVVAGKEKRMEALIDFQNDGYVDALTYWWSGSTQNATSYRLFALVNDQSGAFDVSWEGEYGFQDEAGSSSFRAILGNLNGDEYVDFIVFVDRSLHVFHSNGLATPDLVQEMDLLWTGQHVVTDLNGDGLDDLVAASRDDHASVWMNSGAAGGFQLQPVADPDQLRGEEIRSGELNGDQSPDLLAYQYGGGLNLLRIFAGNGDGTFQPPQAFFTNESGYPVIGDVDGDGDQDIVLFGEDTYKVLERTGPDSWQYRPTGQGGPAYALADIDLDGDLDGICCGGGTGGGGDTTNEIDSTMHVSLNDGTGSFAPSIALPALGSRFIAGAADLDHDGDVDLVAGRTVYYGNGSLNQHPWVDMGISFSSASMRYVVDYEGDGDLDLRNHYGHEFRNDGRGKFTYMNGTEVGPIGPGFAGDFDGDGHSDFMTRTEDGEPRLCRGDGAGSVLDPEACADPSSVDLYFGGGNYLPAVNGLVVDIDLDGDLDVLARHRQFSNPQASRDTFILSNDGSGWFELTRTFEDTLAVALGNADGDRHPDLFAVQPSSSLLGYYAGRGDGVFEAAFVPIHGSEVSYTHHELAVDDWNADGFSDVAVPTVGQNLRGFSIYWGTGSGAFVEQQLDSPKASNECLAHSVDVDGNGWTDLVIGNTGNQAIILRRRDDGSGFRPRIVQLFHPEAVGDFDTDGDLDFTHGQDGYSAGNQRWVPNRMFDGDSAGRHRQYGLGSGGSGGLRPILGAKGPVRVGESAELRLLGGRGGALAQLKIAFAASDIPDYPFPGMHGYAHPWFRRLVIQLDGEEGLAGAGRKTIAFVVPASIAGSNLYYQFFVLDPEAPFGWAASNGLEIRYR